MLTIDENIRMIEWAQGVGIKTPEALRRFKVAVCKTDKNSELLRKLHGCLIHKITFEELNNG